jgi:hypothetical protein
VPAALVSSWIRLARIIVIITMFCMHNQLVSQVLLFLLRDQNKSAVLALSDKDNILGAVLRRLNLALSALPFHGG